MSELQFKLSKNEKEFTKLENNNKSLKDQFNQFEIDIKEYRNKNKVITINQKINLTYVHL